MALVPAKIQGMLFDCDCDCHTCDAAQNAVCDRRVADAYADLDNSTGEMKE